MFAMISDVKTPRKIRKDFRAILMKGSVLPAKSESDIMFCFYC